MAACCRPRRWSPQAAKRARRKPLPKPRDLPIDTFVVLMMENRSFDHYFGWHPHADAQERGPRLPEPDGSQRSPTHHLTPDFQGCGFRDPDHGWDGGRFQYNGGKLDGFYSGNEDGTGSDEYALGYYLKEDLGFIPHAADAYQLYDRYFCSIMGSTYPNRHYQLAAQNGGQKSNELPASDRRGFQWETIFDRAQARGLERRATTSPTCRCRRCTARAGSTGCARRRSSTSTPPSGRLPHDLLRRPAVPRRRRRQRDLGRRASARRRPPRPGVHVRRRARVHRVAAVQARRACSSTTTSGAGSSTTSRPHHVPDDRANRSDLENDWSLTGFRDPGGGDLAVHARAQGRRVSHMTCTHESILKLIAYRYGLGYLNKRHRYASNIGRSFDFSKRDFEPPTLPDPAAIAAIPCCRSAAAARPKQHDLVKLETSGLLDRLGYEVPKVTYDSLFRYPDRVRRAFEAAG